MKRIANLTEMFHPPQSVVFDPPLTTDELEALTREMFEQEGSIWFVWGNPIRLQNRVHVYGLDLVRWEPVYFDLLRRGLTIIAPITTREDVLWRLLECAIGRFEGRATPSAPVPTPQ